MIVYVWTAVAGVVATAAMLITVLLTGVPVTTAVAVIEVIATGLPAIFLIFFFDLTI